jgi:hypothetical protein
MNTPLSTGAAEVASADTYDVQPRQVPYVPKSKGFSTQTLIPFNMASAAQQALELFEQQHGDIDAYLATRLGYGSVEELHQYFSAEQVDASALAISNIERGAGSLRATRPASARAASAPASCATPSSRARLPCSSPRTSPSTPT